MGKQQKRKQQQLLTQQWQHQQAKKEHVAAVPAVPQGPSEWTGPVQRPSPEHFGCHFRGILDDCRGEEYADDMFFHELDDLWLCRECLPVYYHRRCWAHPSSSTCGARSPRAPGRPPRISPPPGEPPSSASPGQEDDVYDDTVDDIPHSEPSLPHAHSLPAASDAPYSPAMSARSWELPSSELDRRPNSAGVLPPRLHSSPPPPTEPHRPSPTEPRRPPARSAQHAAAPVVSLPEWLSTSSPLGQDPQLCLRRATSDASPEAAAAAETVSGWQPLFERAPHPPAVPLHKAPAPPPAAPPAALRSRPAAAATRAAAPAAAELRQVQHGVRQADGSVRCGKTVWPEPALSHVPLLKQVITLLCHYAEDMVEEDIREQAHKWLKKLHIALFRPPGTELKHNWRTCNIPVLPEDVREMADLIDSESAEAALAGLDAPGAEPEACSDALDSGQQQQQQQQQEEQGGNAERGGPSPLAGLEAFDPYTFGLGEGADGADGTQFVRQLLGSLREGEGQDSWTAQDSDGLISNDILAGVVAMLGDCGQTQASSDGSQSGSGSPVTGASSPTPEQPERRAAASPLQPRGERDSAAARAVERAAGSAEAVAADSGAQCGPAAAGLRQGAAAAAQQRPPPQDASAPVHLHGALRTAEPPQFHQSPVQQLQGLQQLPLPQAHTLAQAAGSQWHAGAPVPPQSTSSRLPQGFGGGGPLGAPVQPAGVPRGEPTRPGWPQPDAGGTRPPSWLTAAAQAAADPGRGLRPGWLQDVAQAAARSGGNLPSGWLQDVARAAGGDPHRTAPPQPSPSWQGDWPGGGSAGAAQNAQSIAVAELFLQQALAQRALSMQHGGAALAQGVAGLGVPQPPRGHMQGANWSADQFSMAGQQQAAPKSAQKQQRRRPKYPTDRISAE